MIEVHATILGILLLIVYISCMFGIVMWSIARCEKKSASIWRKEYETLNAKVRPEFQAAVDHFIPRSEPAAKRIERLRKALDQ